jgi:CRISPR-associated protein Csb2
LECLARRVAYLGRAKTLVIITVPENPDAMPAGTVIWVPDQGSRGSARLRVPTAGLLHELDQDYASGVRAAGRRPAALHSYRKLGLLAAQVTGPWGTIGAWRLASGSVPPTYALLVCHALREAALSREGDTCPPEISGHGRSADGTSLPLASPHAAWLPLVDAGHDFASGRLLGFGVALPPGIRLPDMPKQFRVGFRRLAIKPVDESRRPPMALTPWRWTQPSQCWASVTPVALPWRGARPDRRAAERAVKAACVKAGFPRPGQVAVDDLPFVRGPARAQDYLRARPGETARRACHVIVRFDAEVRGPVILGPLRYFGLGLMIPYDPGGAVR